ncbi:MAG: hypothetical protein J6386_10900 [Candidatus Synoicihabitans palmerolidicus]|nr:hypothetical protein [Candidatus Synoicihabitans palmerolidicus]
MDSDLSDQVVTRLSELSTTEQTVVLEAIADLRLSKYEPAVLALLADATPELKPLVVRTLSMVGADASFQSLLDLYLANRRDRAVAAALARLNTPSTDQKLLSTVRGKGGLEERVAALQLLALRNRVGIIPILNEFGRVGTEPELRTAADKGMEVVGDTESVRLLLSVVLSDDSLKRAAQGSFKKLSANLSVPDFLWNDFYAPAMAAADNDDRRRDVLAILDGNSGPAAAGYLQKLILENHPLRADALNSLRRWTDISGVDAWLVIATAEGATETDIAAAKQGMIRLVGSTRVTGGYPAKVERAVAALRAFLTDSIFKRALLRTYDRKLYWQTRVQISRLFPEFLSSPDIRIEVQELLDRASFD